MIWEFQSGRDKNCKELRFLGRILCSEGLQKRDIGRNSGKLMKIPKRDILTPKGQDLV